MRLNTNDEIKRQQNATFDIKNVRPGFPIENRPTLVCGY